MLAFVVDRSMGPGIFLRDDLTIEHPKAADKDVIIEWTLKEFLISRFIRNLLLQYNSDGLTDSEVWPKER